MSYTKVGKQETLQLLVRFHPIERPIINPGTCVFSINNTKKGAFLYEYHANDITQFLIHVLVVFCDPDPASLPVQFNENPADLLPPELPPKGLRRRQPAVKVRIGREIYSEAKGVARLSISSSTVHILPRHSDHELFCFVLRTLRTVRAPSWRNLPWVFFNSSSTRTCPAFMPTLPLSVWGGVLCSMLHVCAEFNSAGSVFSLMFKIMRLDVFLRSASKILGAPADRTVV